MMGFTKHIKERGTKLVSNIAGNMSPVPPRIDANGITLKFFLYSILRSWVLD